MLGGSIESQWFPDKVTLGTIAIIIVCIMVHSGDHYKWDKWLRDAFMCVIWSWHSVPFCVINLTEQSKTLITLFKFNRKQPCFTRGKQVITETTVCRCPSADKESHWSLPCVKKNGKVAWLWHLSYQREGGRIWPLMQRFFFFFCHQMDTLPIISV